MLLGFLLRQWVSFAGAMLNVSVAVMGESPGVARVARARAPP